MVGCLRRGAKHEPAEPVSGVDTVFFRIQEKTKSTTTSERCLLTRSKTPFPCEYSLRMYNRLVEKCFKDCVDSFRRKNLDSNEERVRERERRPSL